MSDELSDAEKIRNKRLAKLGSATTPSPSNDAASSATNVAGGQSSSTPELSNSSTKPATTNGHEQANETQVPKPTASAKPSASPSSLTTPVKRDSENTPRPRSQQGAPETIEDWEDKTLCNLFRITLKADPPRDGSRQGPFFLRSLKEDLETAGQEPKLSVSLLDQALVEAVGVRGNASRPLDYFLSCWKRIIRLQRTQRSGTTGEAKSEIVKEARRLCMSYAIFAITLPDIFGENTPITGSLVPNLLSEPGSEQGLDFDFISDAVARFPEDDGIKTAFVEAAEELSRELSKMTMNDDYRSYVNGLRNLVRFAPLVTALSESSIFCPPDVAAQDIEKATLLGPLFQLSPLQGEVAVSYFSAHKTRDRAYIANNQHALRITLTQHQSDIFDIVDRFIKVSAESRNRMLDWFALAVNKNHKRRAIRTDFRYVSSDGFMQNVTICLDKLSEPFMDASFSKVHRIEAEYFRRKPRVEISDETKTNADQETSDRFYAQPAGGTNNFISEVFFLTVAAHHYGTEAAQTKMSDLRRQLKHMDKEIERLEAEREKYTSQPPHVLQMFDTNLKRYKDQAERGHCVLIATEGVLLDEQSQARAMLFMRYVIVWLVRVLTPIDFPKQLPTLPLPREQPEVFKCLPEYFIEDIVDHFKFVTSNLPHIITPAQCTELVAFSITFLRNSDHIKNPYLKSGLISILFYGVSPMRRGAKGILDDILNTMEFAHEHLLHALMQWYIECEVTGAHNQFFDKFNIRWEIFQVIKRIWGNPIYRTNLATESRVNVDFFVRFVNLLLNDVTFVLDESFTAFVQISSLEKELRDLGPSMGEEERKQKEELLESNQGKAKSYMQLTTETLIMLKLFTDALADAFTMPIIVQRLADMLDYNLDALVGNKAKNLRVENRHEYNFDPASLLSDIVDVFLNLGAKKNFQVAVARDGRSYKPANFTEAHRILREKTPKSPEELQRWLDLGAVIEAVRAEEQAEEDDLGDIPEQYMDPLMATLMTDPVTLPISKNVVDRSTIESHLLSDTHDPFNRTPLKIEDVIPNEELRAEIETWKREKKAAKQAERDAVNEMDTTAG